MLLSSTLDYHIQGYLIVQNKIKVFRFFLARKHSSIQFYLYQIIHPAELSFAVIKLQ